ncbi:MAG TPA: outer membrane beta-barrel protein [Candidatus Krumholzibacteria bacterium]|nr:outer membrane beta-barrel protein [Candidatus Krumholzibacteria bacterium]HPD72704.1 outer membrane beta-barrel protein [Candidatus Krumholzibacteria bacterium]HRY40364.1 outer membrane beta-barrel protein [Candidatus Krumholzibacteria bacterium]
MARQSSVILFSVAVLLAGGLASAQDTGGTQAPKEPERVFNLVIGGEETEEVVEETVEEARWEPQLALREVDVTLTLGFFGMTETVLEHDNLIYKATDEAFNYADVELVGDSAFSPVLRGGYNLNSWFGLEAQFGATFAEYNATLTDAFSIDPANTGNPIAVPSVGEFDAEHRSMLIFISSLNALVYPLNLDGDPRGRVHPYFTGGVGYVLYNLDSNYVDESATGIDANAGIGVKILADKLIHVRAELVYHVHSIEMSPAENFDQRDEGTVTVPVYEFDDFGNYRPVESFSSQTLGGLSWQIGFGVTF